MEVAGSWAVRERMAARKGEGDETGAGAVGNVTSEGAEPAGWSWGEYPS